MSNSGGEEELLSTPTEDGSIEDAVKDDDEEDNLHEIDDNGPSFKVKIAPKKPQSSKQERRNGAIMTRSEDSPPDQQQIAREDPKMPRRYTQISEENLVLKKQLKKQEERIKVLATKLIHVISERSNKGKREEIMLEDQKTRISDLEHEVSNLRSKLQVSKQQLSSYTKLIPNHPLPLHHHNNHHTPPSRQASMLSSSTATTSVSKLKKPRSARSVSGGGGGSRPPRPNTATSSSHGNLLLSDKKFADRVEELLLEAKAENQALEDQLKHCRQRLSSTEAELEKTKEELNKQLAEHHEEVLTIKSQLGKEQDIANKKKQLSDNIQLIRLQRESRRTASWLSTLEAQCSSLESRLVASTENAGQLETQLTEAQEELGQEQQKNITLQKQLEDATSSLNRLKELEAQISSLQEENTILKEANESLLKKAFSVTQKAEKAESAEISLKVQMSHLENVLKAEMKTKQELLENLREEKEKCIRLETTNEMVQQTLDKLNEEMQKLAASSKEAVAERNKAEAVSPPPPPPRSVENKEQQTEKCNESSCPHLSKVTDLEDELTCTKLQLAALKDEQTSTTSLLKSQVAANVEYQREISALTNKLDEADDFHHKKLQNFVKVLEERTRQISHLEKFIDDWKNKQTGEAALCPSCCIKNSTKPTDNTIIGKGDGHDFSDEDDSKSLDVNSQDCLESDATFMNEENNQG